MSQYYIAGQSCECDKVLTCFKMYVKRGTLLNF